MAGALSGHDGGIAGLLSLLDEHQEAIEFDLIERGLRLDQVGSDTFSWRDLLVIVRQLPASSALARAKEPDIDWQLQPQLMAQVVDELRELQWLVVTALSGGKGKVKRPDPLPRPGVGPQQGIGANEGFDSDADLAAWYAGLDLAPPASAEPVPPVKQLPPRDSRGRFVART